MENGDKNYYRYEFTGTSKNGAFESGTNKWSMTEGGGKMKGGKASGACTAKGNADGSTSFDCMGTYPPAAKQSLFLALLSRVATSALGLRSIRIPTTPAPGM